MPLRLPATARETQYPGYFATRDGRILSTKGYRGVAVRVMETYPDRSGYARLCIYHEGRRHTVGAHVLVATAFYGPPSPDQEVRHLNGKPADNRVINLRWGTRVENAEDRSRHGTLRGERTAAAKLTDNIVRTARKRYARGESQSALAREYGVVHQTMRHALLGLTWKHVT